MKAECDGTTFSTSISDTLDSPESLLARKAETSIGAFETAVNEVSVESASEC